MNYVDLKARQFKPVGVRVHLASPIDEALALECQLLWPPIVTAACAIEGVPW